MASLRSEEFVVINGNKMPRWVAEKCGLIPVTVVRTIRAMEEGVKTFPISFVYTPEELSGLFQSGQYCTPAKRQEPGYWYSHDRDRNKCLCFWPFFNGKV